MSHKPTCGTDSNSEHGLSLLDFSEDRCYPIAEKYTSCLWAHDEHSTSQFPGTIWNAFFPVNCEVHHTEKIWNEMTENFYCGDLCPLKML